MDQLTLWSEGAHAKASPSQERERALQALPDSCLSTYGRYLKSCLGTGSGKTSQVRSVARGGADFECFLGEMAGIRGASGERYGIGWRVLDAQFFGVAQRRRRLFAVGVLGDLGGPSEILFESEGLCRDTPSSREKRKALAAHAGSGPAGADGRRVGAVAFAQNTRDEVRVQGDGTLSGALAAQPGAKQQTYVAQSVQPVVMASAHYNAEIGEGGVVPTLIAHIAKDAPVLAMGTTCSRASAPRTATSSSSTTRASGAGDSSCSGVIAMADDNAKTAVDVEMCGSLKVGGAPPMIALQATETM